jgi:hypothetical protein
MSSRHLPRNALRSDRRRSEREIVPPPTISVSRQVLWDKEKGIVFSATTKKAIRAVMPKGARSRVFQHRMQWQRVEYLNSSALGEQVCENYAESDRNDLYAELAKNLYLRLRDLQVKAAEQQAGNPRRINVGLDRLVRMTPIDESGLRGRTKGRQRLVAAVFEGWAGHRASYPDNEVNGEAPGLLLMAKEHVAVRQAIRDTDSGLDPDPLMVEPSVVIIENRKTEVPVSDVEAYQRILTSSGVLPANNVLAEPSINCVFADRYIPNISLSLANDEEPGLLVA